MSEDLKQTSFLFGSNAIYIEELYKLYLLDNKSVDESWQEYFRNISNHDRQTKVNYSDACSTTSSPRQSVPVERYSAEANTYKAIRMIESYRNYGHFLVKLDPLDREILKSKSDLKLNIADFGFSQGQLGETIEINNEFFGIKSCVLSVLIDSLEQAYTQDIAVEFNNVVNQQEKSWLCEQIENKDQHINLSAQDKKNILKDLIETEGFEQYLHIKFPGAKRFSIEGAEATIVAIDRTIDILANYGATETVIGMAHRGRISALTKIMGKPYKEVISGFMTGNMLPSDLGIAGDVKYHLGYSSDRVKDDVKIHLSMAYNPSHLEAVNPVVAGMVRAKQDNINDIERTKVVGILIHGDSAFCGQGVVAESLSMSDLKPYNVGGIIHFVINNQVGFTANIHDTRTSRYSTEFAKILNIPIFHVDGDNIEAVMKATDLAIKYRHKFSKDVVIEIICYRKYGHNEGDEPMYTQGVMYNAIKSKNSPTTIYANALITDKIIDAKDFVELKEQFKLKLDQEYKQAKNYQPQAQFLQGLWAGYARNDDKAVATGVDKNSLKELAIELCQIPDNFPINPKLAKLFELRENTLKQGMPIDWATAEQLAFGSLLNDGINIRFTGQDSRRGTFSHRHAVICSQVDDRTYTPLNNLSLNQGNFEITDSNLSEYAVLGFEYGYSLVNPKYLVIWEAQFGDFANGAQIIFDQFIASSETKWLRMSGIVALLPHGFEGQGAEHSSARLERFLQLAAENNIQVVYPTTPASLFHLLRRQIYSNIRKPLIVMSPKSLLRNKMVTSSLSELDTGTSFAPILDEVNSEIKSESVRKVILCSGKVYYDLLEKRIEKKILDIVIIRLEQLYPFEKNIIMQILGKYSKASKFIWCQEEPKNMGAWNFACEQLNEILKDLSIKNQFKYVGKDESASPAVGSLYLHNEQQAKLITEAFI